MKRKGRVLRKKSEAKATLTSEACPVRENTTGPVPCTHHIKNLLMGWGRSAMVLGPMHIVIGLCLSPFSKLCL